MSLRSVGTMDWKSFKGRQIVPDPTVTFNIDVYCIYEDKEHNIWLGTKDNGLYLLHPERDNSYRITHHLSDKTIRIVYLPIPSTPFCKTQQDVYG